MNEHESDTITGIRVHWYEKFMAVLGAGRVYRQALFLLEPKAGERVLDVGCGTGTFLKLLRVEDPESLRGADSNVSLDLIGIDVSEDMLREARKNASGISLRCADASALPFANESFDAVVSILALHHMSEAVKKQAIGEATRVLKKDGRLIILDLFRPKSRWGSSFRFWFNLHSFTRGNWELILSELAQKGFTLAKEGAVRGFVGYLTARPASNR